MPDSNSGHDAFASHIVILTGSILLIFGVIGVTVSLIDRTTTGWSGTRPKFVVTSWGLLAGGVTIIIAGIHDAELIFRWFAP